MSDLEEKTNAVQEAIRNEIASVRKIARDMDENEARVANAILTITVVQQLAFIQVQLAELRKCLAAPQAGTVLSASGQPIMH